MLHVFYEWGCETKIEHQWCFHPLWFSYKKKYFFCNKSANKILITIYFLRKRRLGNNFLSKYFLFKNVLLQSPRFENFCSSRNSFNPTFRPNLWPNSDDSLCHVIDSCKIFGSTWGVRSNENKTNLGWF